ncbi:MAG: hypothetical protein ACRD7E_29785, partial [Bryobacteraceae bacterium]
SPPSPDGNRPSLINNKVIMQTRGQARGLPSSRKEREMDVRAFFHKVRQVEATIVESHVVVVSLETPDGGRPGVMTQVSKPAAARMIVEGRARLASKEEAETFRYDAQEAKRAADQLAAASRLNLTVISDEELKSLKLGGRSHKS